MSNSVSATKELLQDLLKQYPEKTAKKRAGHITVKETTTDETGASSCSSCAVKSNVKSIPGVMTARGCAYAGSKGVVWGPIRDMVHLSHGPVGCGSYSWSTRRNLAQGTHPAPTTSSPSNSPRTTWSGTSSTAARKGRPVIYDDATEHEMEELVKRLKPDLVGAGIKEKYVFQKMGVPFRQMHSWDYSGPYHGYEGFPIFARDMDMAINSPTWKLVKDPFAASGLPPAHRTPAAGRHLPDRRRVAFCRRPKMAHLLRCPPPGSLRRASARLSRRSSSALHLDHFGLPARHDLHSTRRETFKHRAGSETFLSY